MAGTFPQDVSLQDAVILFLEQKSGAGLGHVGSLLLASQRRMRNELTPCSFEPVLRHRVNQKKKKIALVTPPIDGTNEVPSWTLEALGYGEKGRNVKTPSKCDWSSSDTDRL